MNKKLSDNTYAWRIKQIHHNHRPLFLKDLQKISRPEQVRIRQALAEIEANPYQGRKIVSANIGQYRWRVGNYRIRYDITGNEVHILRVIKREDAYRRF